MKQDKVLAPTTTEYIEKFRSSLLEALMTSYNGKLSNELLEKRVEKLFPDKNFYFY